MHETRYVYSSSVSHPSWTADENSSPDQLTTYCVVCWHVTSTCVIFVSYLYRATMCNLISVVLRWYDEANTHLKEVLNPKWNWRTTKQKSGRNIFHHSYVANGTAILAETCILSAGDSTALQPCKLREVWFIEFCEIYPYQFTLHHTCIKQFVYLVVTDAYVLCHHVVHTAKRTLQEEGGRSDTPRLGTGAVPWPLPPNAPIFWLHRRRLNLQYIMLEFTRPNSSPTPPL